jgi:hypothetical protein
VKMAQARARKARFMSIPNPGQKLRPGQFVLGIDGSFKCSGWAVADHRGELVDAGIQPFPGRIRSAVRQIPGWEPYRRSSTTGGRRFVAVRSA